MDLGRGCFLLTTNKKLDSPFNLSSLNFHFCIKNTKNRLHSVIGRHCCMSSVSDVVGSLLLLWHYRRHCMNAVRVDEESDYFNCIWIQMNVEFTFAASPVFRHLPSIQHAHRLPIQMISLDCSVRAICWSGTCRLNNNFIIWFQFTRAENSNAIFARIKAAPDMKATLDKNSCAKNAIKAIPTLEHI